MNSCPTLLCSLLLLPACSISPVFDIAGHPPPVNLPCTFTLPLLLSDLCVQLYVVSFPSSAGPQHPSLPLLHFYLVLQRMDSLLGESTQWLADPRMGPLPGLSLIVLSVCSQHYRHKLGLAFVQLLSRSSDAPGRVPWRDYGPPWLCPRLCARLHE